MENTQISEQLHFLDISENDFNVNMRNLAKDESLNVKELLYEYEQSIKIKKTKKKLSKSEQFVHLNISSCMQSTLKITINQGNMLIN